MNNLRELLNREIYRRSISGLFAHLFFLALIIFVLDGFYANTLYRPFPVLLLVVGLALRTLCLVAFKNKELVRKSIFFIGTLILGIAWGELALQIISYYGVESIQTMIAIGLLSTMVAISVSSLSAFPPALIVFLITCTAYPSYILFSQKQVLWNYLGLFFLLNLIYQLFAGYRIYRSIVKQLRELSKARRERQRLQEIIDAIPSLVIIINTQKTYEMVNNFQDGLFQKMFLGQDLGVVLPHSPVEKAFLNFLESNKSSESLEIQSYDFGPEDWFLVTMNRLDFDRGIICNVLPITDFVKTRNELQIQQARNDYASKLISLGEVAANITHELGNPLAIIRGCTEILKSELADSESSLVIKKINDIDSTVTRMAGIINGLKSISQHQGLELKNVKFKDVIEPVKEITSEKIKERGINLIVENEDESVDLFCDEVQISQVLLNLVGNAIDAISENDEKWIRISYKPGLEWCSIKVQDSGKITSEEVIEKMMLPFFTTQNNKEGTGLGLSLSEKIIKEHQGRLTYLKEEPTTTFLISLPRMT